MGRNDELDQIEDGAVRRLVAASLHVRSYLPFYVLGMFMAVTLAIVPAVGRGGGSSGADLAGTSTGALRSASGARGAGSSPAGSSQGLAPVIGALPSVADGGFFTSDTGLEDGAAGDVLASLPTAGNLADQSGGTTPGVNAPTFDPSSDVPDAPEPCKITAPSPAPSVDPNREIDSAQNTAEAAAGQQLPARISDAAKPATDAAACNVPEAPVAVPSVPLPATPVSKANTDKPPSGWLARIVSLFS